MDVVDRLDLERRQLNVLSHPFYVRWTRGELSSEELAGYAAQYRYLVVALADVSALAAGTASGADADLLELHANEEAAHIAMWDQFVQATGATADAATDETFECASSWTAPATIADQLATMYVIEASQPAISATKLLGLAEHYGHPVDSPASEYFREHAVADIEHSRQARELIRRVVDADDRDTHERMLSAARAALRGNWHMLDGVDAATASHAALS